MIVLVEKRESVVDGFCPKFEGEVIAETTERYKVKRMYRPWWAQQQICWVCKDGNYTRCRVISFMREAR